MRVQVVFFNFSASFVALNKERAKSHVSAALFATLIQHRFIKYFFFQVGQISHSETN